MVVFARNILVRFSDWSKWKISVDKKQQVRCWSKCFFIITLIGWVKRISTCRVPNQYKRCNLNTTIIYSLIGSLQMFIELFFVYLHSTSCDFIKSWLLVCAHRLEIELLPRNKLSKQIAIQTWQHRVRRKMRQTWKHRPFSNRNGL